MASLAIATAAGTAANLLSPTYNPVIIPSSQSGTDRAASIEKAYDGNAGTYYESAPNEHPWWLEIRWPQLASPLKVRAIFQDIQSTPEYISARIPEGDGAWREVSRQNGNAYDDLPLPKVSVPALRLYFGKTPSGVLRITELAVAGNAPSYTLKNPDWKGEYIWYPEPDVSNVTRYFRRKFQVPSTTKLKNAIMQISADDVFFLHVNGNYLGTGSIPTITYDVKKYLKDGDNLIAIKAQEYGGGEGVLYELTLVYEDGTIESIISDSATVASQDEVEGWEKNDNVDGFVPARPSGRSKSGVSFTYHGNGRHPIRIGKITGKNQVKTGESIKLAFSMAAGEKLQDDFGFKVLIGAKSVGQNADYRVATLELFPETPTSQWETGKTYDLIGNFYIPKWAPDGIMPISVTAISKNSMFDMPLPKSFNGIDIQKFASRTPLKSTLSKAEIRTVEGSTKLFVDGEAVCPFIMTDAPDPDAFHVSGNNCRSGAEIVRIFLVQNDFWSPTPETREQQLSRICAILDQRADFMLRQNQNAYIIFGLAVCPSAEWSTLYPDDNTVITNGFKLRHSFSSQNYLTLGEEGLRYIAKHAASSPYAGHIIGFHFGIGEGPETYCWGSQTNAAGTKREDLAFGDVSPVAIAAFRNYLKDKYGTVEALRNAWKNQEVTFENATPVREEITRMDTASFRDPAKGRMPMDFWEFQADSVALTAKRFAKAIKEASSGQWLCGLWGFYNVAMNHCTSAIGKGHIIGYNAVEKILPDPNIDYLAGIQCYSGVNQGTPVVSLFTYGSLRRHNKLFLEEYDIRTFFTDLSYADGHLLSERENHKIIKRDFGKSIAQDHGCWWVGFPVGIVGRLAQGWYSEDGLLKLLNECHKIRKATYKYPYKPVAEVGLFFEDRDIATLDIMTGDATLASSQYGSIWDELSLMGVPFELNSLSDLNEASVKQYKVVMLMDAYYLTAEQRANIDNVLKKNGKTVVWLYAPGIIDRKDGLKPELVEKLTGISLASRDGAISQNDLTVKICSTMPDFAEASGKTFGPRPYMYDPRKITLEPTFEVTDNAAEILARYAKDDKPAAALKEFKDWTSVYCALPYLSMDIMDGIFAYAGVHRYSNGKAYMEIGSRFISIHATSQGFKGNITLKEKTGIYDVFSRKTLSTDTSSIELDLPPFESTLLFLGTPAEIEELNTELTNN